jgi:hypothetical protein
MQPEDQKPNDDNPDNISVETTNTEVGNTVPPTESPAESPAETTPAAFPDAPTVTDPSAVPTEPVTGTIAAVPTQVTPQKKRFSKKVKLLLIGIVVVIVLAAGSAGAYFGIIVPNQPENVLKSAITNTLKEKQISYDGTFDVSAADTAKPGAQQATSMTFKGSGDLDKQTMKTELSVTVSGVKVQGEVRYIDQTVYIKLNDLGAVKNLASAYNAEASSVISKIENQWIEIDKTLLKQANADCVLDTQMTISDEELNSLYDAYTKNAFATIKSTGNEDVNGKAATKFELSLDDNKMADYLKNLSELSWVKKFEGCSKDVKGPDNSTLKDGDITPLTVWVDKDTKRIVKLASQSTEYDAKEKNIKGSGSVTLSYGPITVEKPSGAKPIMTLLSEFAPLYNSGVRGANTGNPLSLLGL